MGVFSPARTAVTAIDHLAGEGEAGGGENGEGGIDSGRWRASPSAASERSVEWAPLSAIDDAQLPTERTADGRHM